MEKALDHKSNAITTNLPCFQTSGIREEDIEEFDTELARRIQPLHQQLADA